MFSNYYAYMEGISYLDSLILDISVKFSMHEIISNCLLSFILNVSLSWKYKFNSVLYQTEKHMYMWFYVIAVIKRH